MQYPTYLYLYEPAGNGADTIRKEVPALEFKGYLEAALFNLVRESGYHVCRMIADRHPQDEEFSRSMNLYRMAVAMLRRFCLDPRTAELFVLMTYNPDDVKPGDNVVV